MDACSDELELLVYNETDDEGLIDRLRARIDKLFGPRAAFPEEIQLSEFISRTIERLRPKFAHRRCKLVTHFDSNQLVWIPAEVLSKIAEGLIRNAFENTPDGSRIHVTVRDGHDGPVLEIEDFGIGISKENQRLIFESYFTVDEAMLYSTRKPYDFGAGGRGFDLLRMKIFSERYHFKIRLDSQRCHYLSQDREICPGAVTDCRNCQNDEDCRCSGRTTVSVDFLPSDELMI